MRKRPLCFMCLIFILIRSILLIFFSGQSLVKVPASSIFLEENEVSDVLIRGQVYKKTNTSKIQILYLKNNSISVQNKSYKESQILVYDDTFTDVPIGKIITIQGKISAFEGARNPGNFDQRLYYAKQGIYGYIWSEKMIEMEGKTNTFQEELYQLRQRWKGKITEYLGEENGAVLSAILLGERSEINEETKELYQKNGISHILAISGLHISFIGLGIYRILRKVGISYSSSGIFSLIVLTLYVCMVGFSVSIFRAYLMLLLRIGADMIGRVYDILTAVMLSAAILVAAEPLYLTDAAFYMSHGAVLGIVLVAPELKKVMGIKNVSVAINLSLFPIMLWFYYEISTYSFALNMVVIPLMSFVLGFGMLGSIGCIIWDPFGKICISVSGFILMLFEKLGSIGGQLPLARLVFGKPNWWEVVLYYLIFGGLILVLKYCKVKKRRILAILAVLIIIFIKFPNGKLQITMLDVGQGDCIFLKGPYGDTYLIDGGSSDVSLVGKYRIEPFLKSQGVGSLDYVFVSHGDSDHYSGILEMLERQEYGVKIKNLILPSNYQRDEELMELFQSAVLAGSNVKIMDADACIQEGKLKITCIQPDEKVMSLEGNAGSMVLSVSFEKFDFLCTGDVESEGEELLTENLDGKAYDVLKVAHHGSKNSTKEEILQIVNPKIALISAGQNNSYGHPHEETLERLKRYGCKILMTTEYGAVRIETNGDLIDILPTSI